MPLYKIYVTYLIFHTNKLFKNFVQQLPLLYIEELQLHLKLQKKCQKHME